MVSSLAFNPAATTNAAGSFGVSWNGLIQGTEYNDPSTRMWLAGGILSTAETLPMWGGVGISEAIPAYTAPYYGGTQTPAQSLGGIITRATNVTANTAGTLTGFSVFTQNYANIANAQSPVPVSLSGMLVNFYRFGTNARIAVPMAPSLVSLVGSEIIPLVSWDFVNQQLIPYVAAYAGGAIGGSATYTSSTGILSVTFGSAPLGAGIGSGANGAYVSISGLTTTVGNAANVNGDFAIVSTASSGTVLNLQAVAGLGTITINSGVGSLAAGGGALACRILDLEVGTSMTVSYNSTTGFTTWNRSGSCAVILI